MDKEEVAIRMQRMMIRGLVLIIAMVILLILAFNEGAVNGEITRIFEGLTIAGGVFFFPDSASLFGWFKNVKITKKNE